MSLEIFSCPKVLILCRVETGNAAFVTDFTKWVFQETGVVKVVSTTHFREGETEPREMYTKKDDIVGFIHMLRKTLADTS